jgi:5-methylcytosine-specific restriction endonuclease McrA
MLLIDKTKEKYGYDPTTLTPSSHKIVIFDCNKCHKEIELRIRYYREDYLCSDCKKETTKENNYKPKVLGLIKFNPPSIVLWQETFDKFGYYPEDLSNGSSRKVVWKCRCGEISESEVKKIREGWSCVSCNQRQKATNRNKQMMDSGLAPNGLPLGFHDKDKARKNNREWYRKFRSTPVGQSINRLRVGLKRIQKGYSFKDLPYSPMELGYYIQQRLEFRNNKCPTCQKSFDDVGYDIDHKTPLSTANTPEEALKLFALDNLDVLCPDCNQFKKRNQVWDY